MKTRTRIQILTFLLVYISNSSLRAQWPDSLVRPVDTSLHLTPIENKPSATKYQLRGRVVDKQSKEPVPFATVFFPYSHIGAVTEADGAFELTFDKPPSDSLRIQLMGYESQNVFFDTAKRYDNLIIELEPNTALLNEVVINAGEDPALALLKKIIARKPFTDPDRLDGYSYETYNKVEVDIVRLSRKQFEMLPVPYIKHFGYIYDNLDTMSGKEPFLPFFLVETLSDYYYQKSPEQRREFIKANQIRGINNKSITQYLGKMHLAINPYDNYVSFFDKKFVSPISNAAAVYYKYRLADTQYVDGHTIIKVDFSPQRPGENCFAGHFRVVDSVYALEYLSAELPAAANINWIKNATLYKQYAPVGDSVWFCVKENLTAEIVTTPDLIQLPGLIGRKTTSYRNIILNDSRVAEIISKTKDEVIISDSARNKSDDFWRMARHEELSKNEQSIYHMFDTLENDPKFARFKNLVKVLFTGVKEVGPLEFGPYWNAYSNNIIEGNRFRFSMGTTPKLSKNIYLNGYLAYGTRDKQFKYNLGALWLLERQPRSYLFASYTSDIDRRVNYYDKVGFDNIFNMAIRKPGIPFKLVFTTEARFEFFKSYHSGFSHKLTTIKKDFDPYDPLPSATIFTDNQGNTTNAIATTEVDLHLRYAYKERFLEGNYYRVSLGSKYPIVEAHYAIGLKGILNGGYNYHRVTISASDEIRIAPLGKLYLNLFGGKYFGALPYLLLENHPGNENYFYNKYAFNMMNNFEFLSDQYAGFNMEHSVGGGVFKYIPVVKKLKLRQFWNAKGIIGSLGADNSAINLNKGYSFRTLEKSPYIEVGTGIENIFRLLRVDFVWRVLPEARPGEPKQKYFGVFGSLKLDF